MKRGCSLLNTYLIKSKQPNLLIIDALTVQMVSFIYKTYYDNVPVISEEFTTNLPSFTSITTC